MIDLKHIALTVCIAVAVSCAQQSPVEVSDPERAAAKHGRIDADKAIEAQAGSKQRERALLQIRAREQKIKETGDSAAATAYIRAAEARLDSAGIISYGTAIQ